MEQETRSTFAALAAHGSPHQGFIKDLISTLGVDGAVRFAKDRHLDGLVREIRLVANRSAGTGALAH